MSLLTTIAGLAGTELRASLRHNLRKSVIWGSAGLAGLAGIGFCLSAVHRAVAFSKGEIWADLIVAAILFFAAAVLLGIGEYLAYRERRRLALTRTLAAAPLAASLLLRKPGMGLAAAAAAILAGTLLGRNL